MAREKVARANRNKAKAGVSWAYMIQAGDNGPIKIGQTRELHTRRRALQAMHYEPLTLLGMIPETWITEAGLQRLFQDLRIRGEWYSPHPQLVAFAKACGRVFESGPVRAIPEGFEVESQEIIPVVLLHRTGSGYRLNAVGGKGEAEIARLQSLAE